MRPFITLPIFAALATGAQAQTTPDAFEFDFAPPFRGTAVGHYAGWDSFSVPFGAPNSADDAASSIAATIEQSSPGAILTTTGNIYNPGTASTFALEGSAVSTVREVVLQTLTLGLPLDPTTVELRYDDGAGLQTVAPTTTTVLLAGTGGFSSEELAFTFDLSELDVVDFGISFNASGANCSLDAVMLDIRVADSIGAPYCSAVPNSTGVVGELVAFGSPIVADQDLVLKASHLPANTFGMYVVSSTQAVIANAGGIGTLCLGGGVGRLNSQIFNSGALGEDSTEIDMSQIPTNTSVVAIAAGETWNFQGWHRDISGGAQTSNFTLPVSVTFQ